MTKYDILIDKRIERLEEDIECLDKVCKSLKMIGVSVEIELIRTVQADLMFVIDNLKLEKQLKNKTRIKIISNPRGSVFLRNLFKKYIANEE